MLAKSSTNFSLGVYHVQVQQVHTSPTSPHKSNKSNKSKIVTVVGSIKIRGAICQATFCLDKFNEQVNVAVESEPGSPKKFRTFFLTVFQEGKKFREATTGVSARSPAKAFAKAMRRQSYAWAAYKKTA